MEVSARPIPGVEIIPYNSLLRLYSWDLHVTSSCHRIKLYSVNKSKPETAKRLAEIEEKGETFEPLTRPLEWELEGREEYLAAMRKHPREPLN